MKFSEIKRVIEKRQRIILILGIVLLVIGILRYVFTVPDTGINLITQLPTVINGTIEIVLGTGLLIGWYLTLRNKQKLIDSEINLRKEAKRKRRNDHNWGT